MDIYITISGKSKLKFEMRSYQGTVESKIKHINDDSRLLGYFKDKIAKEQLKSKVLEESLSRMTGKLRITMEENRVMRERVKEHHQESTEEVPCYETEIGLLLFLVFICLSKKIT